MKSEMNVYKYKRQNHQSREDLDDIPANVANMSSPLIRANRHSDVVDSVANWGGGKIVKCYKICQIIHKYVIRHHLT